MRIDVPELSADEIIYLLRDEITTAGAPSLYIAAQKEYVFQEDFDRAAYGLQDHIEFDLVSSSVRLTVEPWVERGYWILEVTIECALGPTRTSQEDKLIRRDLTLAQFEEELHAPGQKRVTVRLDVETPDVNDDFNRWLADMRSRHPYRPTLMSGQPDTPAAGTLTPACSGLRTSASSSRWSRTP